MRRAKCHQIEYPAKQLTVQVVERGRKILKVLDVSTPRGDSRHNAILLLLYSAQYFLFGIIVLFDCKFQ